MPNVFLQTRLVKSSRLAIGRWPLGGPVAPAPPARARIIGPRPLAPMPARSYYAGKDDPSRSPMRLPTPRTVPIARAGRFPEPPGAESAAGRPYAAWQWSCSAGQFTSLRSSPFVQSHR